MTPTEAIESIEDRIDFLAKKVATDTSGRALHRERREIGALQLAIDGLVELRTQFRSRKFEHAEGCPCRNQP